MVANKENFQYLNSIVNLDTLPIEKLIDQENWERQTGEKPQNTLFYLIIPAHNEAVVISNTIKNLSEQKIPIGSKLIINVIPNGCTDNTEKEVENIKNKLNEKISLNQNKPLEIITTPINEPGKTRALNYGRKQSPVDIVFCMDADTLPSDNAISKMYALMKIYSDCAAASVMPRRIRDKKNGFLQNMQDYYDNMTRDNGAIIGKLMVFKNQKFPDFPLNCMSDDTWLEFTSIQQNGPNSVMFLGQNPDSDVSSYYHATNDPIEYLGQLLRWESSFQHLMKSQTDLKKACEISNRIDIPNKNKMLLKYLKEHYTELPLTDKFIMHKILMFIRKITEIDSINNKFAGKTHWESPKSDRTNIKY